jgi:multidrug efflux pump subunit AcrA (membrane-fusion protein)
MSIALRDRASVRAAIPWVVVAAALVFAVVNLALHDALFHRDEATPESMPAAVPEADPVEEGKGPGGLPESVTLPEGKFQTAGIRLEAARLDALPAELGVPGRIETNLDRQVQVRPRAPGVIREVGVALGQKVRKGQVLAVLDSPEVGRARLDLRVRQRELTVARARAEYDRLVAANVAELIPELRRGTEASVIEKKYAGRPLGLFYAQLMTAYSKYDIASHEEKKMAGLFEKEIVGEHQPYVTKHTREGTQAEFEGALESARFEANQQSLVSSQKARDAEAGVVDAGQRLRILGVSVDLDDALAHPEHASATRSHSAADEDVTAYPVTAPFDATVIVKSPLAVPSQKAEMNDVLFTLADLSRVWVMVNVPESDFALLPALEHGKIRLTATAYPERKFEAKLLSVGATVDPTTRTVPMLAETANPDGLLKIGMFVRIVLDTAVETRALTVPVSAIAEIEGVAGVFVPSGKPRDKNKDQHSSKGADKAQDRAGRTFAFHPVKLGREAGDRRVIESGLAPGAEVVASGAFTLKSELILQNEAGED